MASIFLFDETSDLMSQKCVFMSLENDMSKDMQKKCPKFFHVNSILGRLPNGWTFPTVWKDVLTFVVNIYCNFGDICQMSRQITNVLKFCRTICDLSTHLQTKTWDSPEFCQQMSQVLAVQKLGQFRNVPSFASKNADVSSFARNIKYTI